MFFYLFFINNKKIKFYLFHRIIIKKNFSKKKIYICTNTHTIMLIPLVASIYFFAKHHSEQEFIIEKNYRYGLLALTVVMAAAVAMYDYRVCMAYTNDTTLKGLLVLNLLYSLAFMWLLFEEKQDPVKWRNMMIVGLVLAAVYGYFMYMRYRSAKKALVSSSTTTLGGEGYPSAPAMGQNQLLEESDEE